MGSPIIDTAPQSMNLLKAPLLMPAELRKDKGERAPGGVTPGENPDYYAAVARADLEVRDRSPVKDAKQQRLRPPEKVRAELVGDGSGSHIPSSLPPQKKKIVSGLQY